MLLLILSPERVAEIRTVPVPRSPWFWAHIALHVYFPCVPFFKLKCNLQWSAQTLGVQPWALAGVYSYAAFFRVWTHMIPSLQPCLYVPFQSVPPVPRGQRCSDFSHQGVILPALKFCKNGIIQRVLLHLDFFCSLSFLLCTLVVHSFVLRSSVSRYVYATVVSVFL